MLLKYRDSADEWCDGMKHHWQEWLVRVGKGPLDMARDNARAGRRVPICSGLEREFRALSEAMRKTQRANTAFP